MRLEGLSVTAKSGVIVYGNVLNENTPIGRGVHLFLNFCSLYGGHKPDRPEFIPVYMIYAALDRSECGYEVKN